MYYFLFDTFKVQCWLILYILNTCKQVLWQAVNAQTAFHQCLLCLLRKIINNLQHILPGHVAQSVTCLATDACLTAIPGVASSIPTRSHTFVEIDHEIISTVILLPSADSFKKGCCQLQAKVCAQITGYPLVQACPGKSVVR